LGVDWGECSAIEVFPNGDGSPPPAVSVLPNVIEKNKRTVIIHGTVDFILIAEGYVHHFSFFGGLILLIILLAMS